MPGMVPQVQPGRGAQRVLGTLGSARPRGKRDTMALGTLQPGPRDLRALVASPEGAVRGWDPGEKREGEDEQRAGTERIPEGPPCANGILLPI